MSNVMFTLNLAGFIADMATYKLCIMTDTTQV